MPSSFASPTPDRSVADTSTPPRTPELLAPAGGKDAFQAALANGADAIYLGLSDLNARRGAENFTLETLADATRAAHLAGVRVYLAANTLVLAQEMDDALTLVADAWDAGVDAVIVQDLGLMSLLAKQLPEVRLHASTQVNAHDSAMLDVLVGLGCERVTLAREAPLTDIARFCARPDGPEIEVFVHGAICFCYSGQCLMSSMIGGRSANRGVCAQPCRMPYKLVNKDDEVADVPGDYLLSPKDLSGIEMLPALVRAGVSSLKIEGRMKSPEYVALVTGVYRAALDRAVADPDSFSVLPAEAEILEEAFSRGFTDGYLRGEPGSDMMSYRRPNNRGVPLGRVVAAEEGAVTVSLDRSLCADDRIEFWTRSGRFAQVAGRLSIDGKQVPRAPAGARVTLKPVKRVRLGDRAFRVANADLLSAARRSWSGREDGAEPVVDLQVTLRIGEPLAVVATSGGVTATGTGPVVEPARTRPVTATDVIEHVAGRLGGSGYRAGEVDVDLDADAGIGFSALHAARRDALAALDAQRLSGWQERETPADARRALSLGKPRRDLNATTALVVFAPRAAEASALLEAGADIVLIEEGEPTLSLASRVGVALPRIVTDAEFKHVVRRGREASNALTSNIGVVKAMAELGGTRVHSGPGANALNPWTASVLSDLGADVVWLSEELSGKQAAAVAGSSPAPVGMMALGRAELMVAENCVLAAIGPCDRRCGACQRRDDEWELVDRKGYRFPVYTDGRGRAHIFNSVPLDLSRALPEIVAAGVSFVGVDIRLMEPYQGQRLVRAFRKRLTLAIAGRDVADEPLVEPATSGHFFRGVK